MLHELMRQRVKLGLNAAVIVASISLLAACGGGGGNGPGNPSAPGATVVISGTITFDRVPFKTALGTGLSPATPIQSPARQVTVEAVSSQGTILAQTTTDTAGAYSLTVPASANLFIRAKAEMLKTGAAPTWGFSVRNNTNSDALYALDGSVASSGTSNSTRNLRAASGWNGTTFVDNERAAAPFAILDTVFQAKELVLSASASATFPALTLYWSQNNRPTANVFCPDDGDIGTSFYVGSGAVDECGPQGNALPAGIYILGDFAAGSGDTDEFDAHVVAHEFGHYFEDQFSRSDSFGGEHGSTDRLDLRLAFGEAWGNTYGAMSLNDPEYRDSQDGITGDFGFNLDGDEGNNGWYAELSIGEFLWDVFDSGAEAGDNVALGFAPIFNVMTGAQVSTEALTSVFPFASALRNQNSAAAAAISDLLNRENISGNDAFGSGENNAGGAPSTGPASVLPIYQDITAGVPLQVCTTSTAGTTDVNKLGNRKFLRFDNPASRTVTIQVTGTSLGAGTTAATDPDIYVHRRGTIVLFGESITPNTESIQGNLNAGMHIIEVLDFNISGTNQAARCMTVSVAG